MHDTCLIYLLYDSIYNSVFERHVFLPILNLLKKNPDQKIILISFEREFTKFFKTDPNLQVIILKRLPFISRHMLWYEIFQLKRILNNYPKHKIIARGPIAGYIAYRAKGKQITVQLRGLLTEEYRYSHQYKTGWKGHVHSLRATEFEQLEQIIMRTNMQFEAVSQNMYDYFIAQYKIKKEQLLIAPILTQIISPAQKTVWRMSVRKELNISENKPVYMYCGSVKPWQSIDEMIQFVKNRSAIFLVITTDPGPFQEKLKQLFPENYRLLSVSQNLIYRYIAAADMGLLFRKAHIINHVASPTKLLDYQAVGIPVQILEN